MWNILAVLAELFLLFIAQYITSQKNKDKFQNKLKINFEAVENTGKFLTNNSSG